jgi:hypothetical protein
MTDKVSTDLTYRCVVGHEIPSDLLEELTEVASLDAGASVRLCREHGAPIAVTVLRSSLMPDKHEDS